MRNWLVHLFVLFLSMMDIWLGLALLALTAYYMQENGTGRKALGIYCFGVIPSAFFAAAMVGMYIESWFDEKFKD